MHESSKIQQKRLYHLLNSSMSDYYLDNQIQSILDLMQSWNIDFQESAKLLKDNNWSIDRLMQRSQKSNNLYAKQLFQQKNEMNRSISEQQNIEYFRVEQIYKKKVKQYEQRHKKQQQEKDKQLKRQEIYRKDAEYFNNYEEGNDSFSFLIRTATKNIAKSFNKHQKVRIIFKYVNGCLRSHFENKNSQFDIKFRSGQSLKSLQSFIQQKLSSIFNNQSLGEVLIIQEI